MKEAHPNAGLRVLADNVLLKTVADGGEVGQAGSARADRDLVEADLAQDHMLAVDSACAFLVAAGSVVSRP
eukprot:8539623-Alexandrium_andersonii.AAC.1